MKHIAIIGGGIVGSSTAYHLAKKGYDVTLIDANHRGKATDAAAGIVCPWLTKRRNKAWYALVRRGAAYYPTLIDQLTRDGQEETGYKQVGALWLHPDEKQVEATLQRALQKRIEAPEIGELDILDHCSARALFPPLADHFVALHVAGGARVDGRTLTRAMQQAATQHGATYVEKTASLQTRGEKVGLFINEDYVSTDEIVVTAGAWATSLLAPLGIKLHVREQKGQMIHLQVRDDTNDWPVVMPPGNQYLLAFNEGRIVCGTTHEDGTNFDARITASAVHTLFDHALQTAPGLSQATWLEARVGFRPVVPHFLPVFGTIPSFPHVWLANGLGSSGLTTGPYIGHILASSIAGEPVTIDLNHYNVETIIG
ncbi:D-amino-acid dehydrogenase [Shouchella lonarensis]|uniref:D-amino-acid dehydrogenase n=1 Tax=Shouchella lonarensis TaxID=1464122 RepID=A0A1G6JZ05_9BACI|nr:D-amino-acid dehydrogenase [Shouchella lonarensis]